METRENEDSAVEIDILELGMYLLRKAWVILLAAVIFGAAAFGVSEYMITPKYTSTTQMYVLNRQTNDSITTSDLQSSTTLTKDYIELIQSRTVIEAVIENLGLDMSYEGLLSKLDVSGKTDTRIVLISATDENPYMAREIANEIRTIASEHIQNVISVVSVRVVDEANLPTVPSSPSVKKNVLLACLLGAFLVIAILSVKFILNDKIRTAEDIDRYLGISVLGVLPVDGEVLKQKKKRKKQSRKK